MTQTVHVLLLAGGSGERFWPLSRKCRPKQFLKLAGRESLLRETVRRARALAPPERIWVLGRRDLEAALREELPEIPSDRFLLEPVGRNTCPAVALGCHRVAREDPAAAVAVLPSDHWIGDDRLFAEALQRALEVARSGFLVTFGIVPTRAETGYGYLERGDELPGKPPAHRVARFHEKPDLETARRYLASGRHYWNSGIFVWGVGTFLEELERHQPAIHRALPSGDVPWGERELEAFFGGVPSISVDYGVLEKSQRVAMVEGRFPWSDLGTWLSWAERLEPDAAGNRCRGDVVAVASEGNVVYSEDPGRVALLGVRDLVVVRTGDVTLVCPKSRVQEIRDLVRRIREVRDDDPYL
jgi:mannose-1-phosphate guanylyltransferase